MRTPILYTQTYKDAATAKVALQKDFPEKIFQVRKRHNGFSVVERTFPGNQEKITPKAKRAKNRGISF